MTPYKQLVVCVSLALGLTVVSTPSNATEDLVEVLAPDTQAVKIQNAPPPVSNTQGSTVPKVALPRLVPCNVTELQTAISEANDLGYGVLWLASNCVYSVSAPATSDDAFPVITGDIVIKGLGNTVLTRDPNAPSFRLFNVSADGKLDLVNLTLANGLTAGLGGGIANTGTLKTSHVLFTGNSAANGGALTNASGARAVILHSKFVNNLSTSVGGGAIINFSTLNVHSSVFKLNSAPINGGAINTQPTGETVIKSSNLRQNTSTGLGGAISNLGMTRIVSSVLMFNTGSSGGAIAAAVSDNVIIKSSVIKRNAPDNCSPLNTITHCKD